MTIPILYLTETLHTGGTERQLLLLVQHLDRSRFQPHLCVLRNCGGGHGLQAGLPLFELNFRAFYHPSTLLCVWRLASYIRCHRISIVQTFFQDPTLLAACSRLLHRAKLVGSFRDLGFWRSSKENLKMRLAYPAFAGFIANAQAVKNHFVAADGINPEKIVVIHNGIEPDNTPASSPAEIAGPPVVGIVANLNRPVKRVEDFITAAALVHRRRPETRFVVVGDGHLRTQLEAQARVEGLAEALHFTGLLADPLPQIRSFSVGVITSETEGLCNAILEYMACGIPVVATAVGGNPELVREGENGFLVPVGDVDLMAMRIESLLQDDSQYKSLREKTKVRIAAEFSLKQMVMSHQSYYERLLEN